MVIHNYNNEFFKIAERYHVLIFQHLTFPEILKFMEVQQRIQSTFESCAHCMGHVVASLEGDRHQVHSRIEGLAKSKRDYRTIRLNALHIDDLSRTGLYAIQVHYQTCRHLTLSRIDITDGFSSLSMPRLTHLTVRLSTQATLTNLMHSHSDRHKLRVEHMHPLAERKHIEDVMRYRHVHLLDSRVDGLTPLDLMYNACIDFQLENDRKDDLEELLTALARAANPDEMRVAVRESIGYKLIIRRLNSDFRELGEVELFSRHINKPKPLVVNPRLMAENFLVTLEIGELSFTVIKRLASVMSNLRTLRVYPIDDDEVKALFEHFEKLELVIMEVEKHGMESDVFFTRTMIESKKSRDPLNIFDKDVAELILQHFDIHELFAITEVSSKWNQVISSCSAFNSRYVLRLNKTIFENEDHFLLYRSRKCFENIEIDGANERSSVLIAVDIIHAFSASLRELNLRNIKMHDIRYFRQLVFKKLKAVRIYCVDPKFTRCLFENLKSLEELVLVRSPFQEYYFKMMKKWKSMKILRVIDGRFENFTSYYSDTRDIQVYTLEQLEISFNHANAWWRVEKHEGFETFIAQSSFFMVHTAKFCGIRPTQLLKIFQRMKRISRLELVNMWPSDIHKIHDKKLKLDIYTQNHHYMRGINWRKSFNGLRGIYVGSVFPVEPGYSTQEDHDFRNFVKSNWRKTPYAFTTVSETGSHDPLMRIPEDIHELIFQHFTIKEFRNAIEVSTTWSGYVRHSRVAISRVRLIFTKETTVDREELMKTTDLKCTVISMYGHHLKFAFNFAPHVEQLKVFTGTNTLVDEPCEFPHLHTLIVSRHYVNINDTENVVGILQHFSKVKTLKKLIIYEILKEDSTCNALMTVLKNNPGIEELQLFRLVCYEKIFNNDIRGLWPSPLVSLTIDIGCNQYSLRNTPFEANFVEFLKLHRNTLKTLKMRAMTGRMMTEVFSNFKSIESFYCVKCSALEDFRVAKMNESLIYVAVPNDLNDIRHIVEFVNRAPNCEYMYVHSLSLELMRDIVLKLRSLKTLTFKDERDNCTKQYKSLLADNNNQLNSDIYFKKISAVKHDLEHMDYEQVFNSRW